MNTYTDEYLDHYADRYIDLGLHAQRITLEQYLAAPDACERAAAEFARVGYAPEPMVLPQRISVMEAHLRQEQEAQQYLAALAAEAERGLDHLPRRNGAIVEPLRHHSYSHCSERRRVV